MSEFIIKSASGATLRISDEPEFRIVRDHSEFLAGSEGQIRIHKVHEKVDSILRYINKNVTAKLRRTALIRPDNLEQILQLRSGIIESYGDLPVKTGQLSRFVVAWWANEESRYIRFLGDRIHVKRPLVMVPRLVPFGQDPYRIVFLGKDIWHCQKCNVTLKAGEGVWHGDHFLCDSCQYQAESGFRPAVGRGKKRR